MRYAEVVDRIRTDFDETPAMELTLGQAARLWHIGPDDCRFVLDALVDAGFLHWTARRTIRRRTIAVSREADVRRSGRSKEPPSSQTFS